MKLSVTLLLLLLFVPVSWAMSPEATNNCHCFKDRTFNPEKRFAADNYLLTTSFNSFIAVNFNLSKSQIVMMKMKGGIDPDTLLIALYVAKEGAVDLDNVLAIVEHGGSWEQVFSSASLQGSARAKEIFTEITATKGDNVAAAEIVTDQLLQSYFGMEKDEIISFHKEGATGRESVLVNILAGHSSRESRPTDILTMHSRQQKSWGEIANYFGFTPKETGRLLTDTLKK
jgi:hypothetical protein